MKKTIFAALLLAASGAHAQSTPIPNTNAQAFPPAQMHYSGVGYTLEGGNHLPRTVYGSGHSVQRSMPADRERVAGKELRIVLAAGPNSNGTTNEIVVITTQGDMEGRDCRPKQRQEDSQGNSVTTIDCRAPVKTPKVEPITTPAKPQFDKPKK